MADDLTPRQTALIRLAVSWNVSRVGISLLVYIAASLDMHGEPPVTGHELSELIRTCGGEFSRPDDVVIRGGIEFGPRLCEFEVP